MMKTNNQKKVAVVKGGASGIGLAITEKFIENNILTIIIGRDENKLKAARNKLGELCIPITFYLNELSSIREMVSHIINQHENIDILVNNASINLKKEFQLRMKNFNKSY